MSQSADFLVELGTEELPPKSLLTLARALARWACENGLASRRRSPRRRDRVVRHAAPACGACAATGRARSPTRQIKRQGPAGGERVRCPAASPRKAARLAFATVVRSRASTSAAAGSMEPEGSRADGIVGTQEAGAADRWRCCRLSCSGARRAAPIAKRGCAGAPAMREFVRPVHWAVMLFGTGRASSASVLRREHRQATRAGIGFTRADGAAASRVRLKYVKALQKAQRRSRRRPSAANIIRAGRYACAERPGGHAVSRALLDEVTGAGRMAECRWLGRFDERYLAAAAGSCRSRRCGTTSATSRCATLTAS